jgi:hypothetical protein
MLEMEKQGNGTARAAGANGSNATALREKIPVARVAVAAE